MPLLMPNFIIPFQEREQILAEEIIANLFVGEIQENKCCIVLITGKSGTGKSRFTLKAVNICANRQGWDCKPYLSTITMFSPFDYNHGMKKILYDKDYKKVNIAWLDEARILIDKSKWQTFVNQTIAHVNAMVRGIKPIIFFIVTQSPSDIDASVRKTCDYWIDCSRPRKKSTRFQIKYFYEDKRDIQKIKLRHARVAGAIKMPDGKRKFIKPKWFHTRMPPHELDLIYQKIHDERKGKVLQAKIEELSRSFEKEEGSVYSRVDKLIAWVLAKPERQIELVKKVRGKLQLLPHAKEMYDLTDSEKDYFSEKMEEKLIEQSKEKLVTAFEGVEKNGGSN